MKFDIGISIVGKNADIGALVMAGIATKDKDDLEGLDESYIENIENNDEIKSNVFIVTAKDIGKVDKNEALVTGATDLVGRFIMREKLNIGNVSVSPDIDMSVEDFKDKSKEIGLSMDWDNFLIEENDLTKCAKGLAEEIKETEYESLENIFNDGKSLKTEEGRNKFIEKSKEDGNEMMADYVRS